MDDLFKSFNAVAIMYWVVPGAFFVLFRSFSLRGAFTALGKDDIPPLIIASVIYWYVIVWIWATANGVPPDYKPLISGWYSAVALLAIPSAAGLVFGWLESRDVFGKALRSAGVPFLSPYATAWESIVANLKDGAVLIIYLKDAEPILGRSTNVTMNSAASTDKEIRDIYLDETGYVDGDDYKPFKPNRGAYISAEQIQFIEIITVGAA
jgi:hypothetical protein